MGTYPIVTIMVPALERLQSFTAVAGAEVSSRSGGSEDTKIAVSRGGTGTVKRQGQERRGFRVTIHDGNNMGRRSGLCFQRAKGAKGRYGGITATGRGRRSEMFFFQPLLIAFA